MEYHKINKIKVEAHSQSINKVVTRFESEFDVKAAGLFPTEKLESLIELLKTKNMGNDDNIDELILEAFSIGIQSGFDRALQQEKYLMKMSGNYLRTQQDIKLPKIYLPLRMGK